MNKSNNHNASQIGCLLRKILNESAPNNNHIKPYKNWENKLIEKRSKIWQKKLKQSQISSSISLVTSKLTWDSYKEGVYDGTNRTQMAIQMIESKFLEFWNIVKEICNTDTSDECAQCSYIVFKAIASGKKSARKALERHFGKISAANYGKLVTLVKELIDWQDKYAPQNKINIQSPKKQAKSKQMNNNNNNNGSNGNEINDDRFVGEFIISFQSPFDHVNSNNDIDWKNDSDDDDDDEKNNNNDNSNINTSMNYMIKNNTNDQNSFDEKMKNEFSFDPDRSTKPLIQHDHKAGEFNRQWLEEQCEPYVKYTNTGEVLVNAKQIVDNLCNVLKSPMSDEQIQGEILNLIGFEGFDFISTIIQHRQCIIDDLKYSLNHINNNNIVKKKNKKKDNTVLIGVSVRRESDIKESQTQRKERRRMMRQSVAVDDNSNITETDIKTDAILDEFRGAGNYMNKRGIVLPTGSTRKHFTGYEEVYVPPVIPPPLEESSLININTLPLFAQLAFKGMTHLNRMQSKVYECAFHSNHNMLVCAPTGAGKTNAAMLTVLHEVQQHLKQGVLQKDLFKIVYVAPMKALAQEVQQKFQKRLQPLGISVKELTGDMQLTKKEIKDTQMIVTTPEKWDVVTRKSGDGSLMDMVKLLIIDEVHLLHEERGPVIEILVARTLRQVESSQRMCRIVGLSATLPNYKDVAAFLRANQNDGLFFFGNEYRPVPLTQYYIGVSYPSLIKRKATMNDLAFKKSMESIKNNNQVMIFVHSRRETVKTAEYLIERIQESEDSVLFLGEYHNDWHQYKTKLTNSRSKDLKSLLPKGIGVHHAGMTRPDRNLVEKAFKNGVIQIIVCTATLAWGVNLPAHTVIIKGTKIYDAKRGGFVELGMLDVMQIFGRAGRPQFDDTGEGIIITEHEQLNHYLSLINHQMPIESQFITQLPDHLNAEITLGTVTNMQEAMQWLQYTYLYIRMLRNPMVYGITYDEKNYDPLLANYRRKLILQAVEALKSAKMCRFNDMKEVFGVTHLGRVASHYYINHETITNFNERMDKCISDEIVCETIASCREFDQLKTRDEEKDEMQKILNRYCPFDIKTPMETNIGKANLLLQAYISKALIRESTLISDLYYITQNAGRIARALFEIALKMNDANLASKLLQWCKMIDWRIWSFQHPLRQFSALKIPIIEKLEARDIDIYRLMDMSNQEISSVIRHQTLAPQIKKYCRYIPQIDITTKIHPITREVLRISLIIECNFDWQIRLHSTSQQWWIWCEDPEGYIYHHETFILTHPKRKEQHCLEFTIPIREPLPPQYYLRAINDRWIGSETLVTLSFKHLFLPSHEIINTELLNLQPLPITSLYNKNAESMYSFTHFNPVQTQCFHVLYHTDENVLMGAPTGSGKTIIGELAILRLLSLYPNQKIVYIAPMKALARERIRDWNQKNSLHDVMNCKIVELTGDSAPDSLTLKYANIIITTPEKWDGVSRSWRTRDYVKQVGLVIIDEIHLLGQDRGPVLEVIVSRIRYISSQTKHHIRIIGLSTALSNASDVAQWLGVNRVGLFNFEPKARPVPLTVHISGYPGRFYCPRMATMNKPTYMAITTYSSDKPVLVFVSSRRQTRLTALDLINYTAASGNPQRFLNLSKNDNIQNYLDKIRDPNLRHCLAFGIGMHHAGLPPSDRNIVEELFVSKRIQVLVCTSTLAWGVNLPAYLVVIKGTEYFDGKQNRYVDFPITDVLQMMGRAGRPQYDHDGVACVLVHEPKKNFYLKFLHHPFPVESSLHEGSNLHNTFNAEVVCGTIKSIHDAVLYLTWTFYFRRLLVNPTYYNFNDQSVKGVTEFLTQQVRYIFMDLYQAGCIEFILNNEIYHTKSTSKDLDNCIISSKFLGKMASFYYLEYKTVKMLNNEIKNDSTLFNLLVILCNANEFDELPVRHNEDGLNTKLHEQVPWKLKEYTADSPHFKANLLLQSHIHRLRLPITDYLTDTKSVLDQCFRILQAMIDICVEKGYLNTCLNMMYLIQMIIQGHDRDKSSLLYIPGMNANIIENMKSNSNLLYVCQHINDEFNGLFSPKIVNIIKSLPQLDIQISNIKGGISVKLQRMNSKSIEQSKLQQVKVSKISKPLIEGWWLLLGIKETDRILALKRITLKHITNIKMLFDNDLIDNNDIYLYVISDSYIGLDYQQKVYLSK